jgi:hypothetical protein
MRISQVAVHLVALAMACMAAAAQCAKRLVHTLLRMSVSQR